MGTTMRNDPVLCSRQAGVLQRRGDAQRTSPAAPVSFPRCGRIVGDSSLICSDRSRCAGRFLGIEDRVSSSRGSKWRRLIKLIFAGRNRIIMIRRELPLTTDASPAKPVANFRRGFSFVLAPAAADLVLELNCVVQGFCFFPSWKGFCFCFCLSCSNGLLASLLGLDGNGPDKSQ